MAGEQITTRRDDLVSQATWLLNLGKAGPKFALLLDFFPASLGRRDGAFAVGEQFAAELVFYPSKAPLRALIDQRSACNPAAWPPALETPLADAAGFETQLPWNETAPVLLPSGRIAFSSKGAAWWIAADSDLALPIDQVPPDAVTGMVLDKTAALWNGTRLSVLSAQTKWGRVRLDA